MLFTLLLLFVYAVNSATYTTVGRGWCQAADSTKPLCAYHIGTSYNPNPYSDAQCKGYCDSYTGCMGYQNLPGGQGGCLLYFLHDATELVTYPHYLPGFRSCGAYCTDNANRSNFDSCRQNKDGFLMQTSNNNLHPTCNRKVGNKYLPAFTDYIGGCCAGKNELGTLVNCAGKTGDVCVHECKAKCASMSNCASFETNQIATPDVCWGSTTCRVNEKPNLDCGHNLYIKGVVAPTCTPNEITALPSECVCGTGNCAAGKWCYGGSCQNTRKYPVCPVNFITKVASECICGNDTTTCAVGQWCYEGTCKTSAKCNVRPEVQKNLFYGAKVYGKWNATAKRMYMNFTTPWDVTVGKIAWKNADTTMQYLSTASGLWTVDKTTDPCKHTYNLDVPQTTFFGTGSKFQITGSQLSTKLRVEAKETIKTVKNQQEYDYTRNIKNTVPVLVNLVTKTTIQVRFRSTAAPPGPGPAPALEDFVLFIAAEDNFATDDPHVLITMKVHSRTCVDHSLTDTGVRVKTGADNIKTGSVQNFDWTKDSNGDIIAPYEHNLCVEELKWKFVPKKYKDNTYEIELEFDLKNLPQKFTTIAAIDIQQADVLADVGFTSTITTYNDTNCTVASSKFILGSKFYTKIELTDMIIDADTISCETYKIKQTKAGSTAETDLKAEVKYAFVQRKHPTAKNTHICGAELESHHFHVSVDGYDTVLETEILITYNQTNTRRELISMPLNSGMWDDEVMNAEEFDMMWDDDQEVEIAAQYDETDNAFRNAKRAPDSDDMTCDLFIENEVAKSSAVGDFMSQESTSMFFSMTLCFLVVGAAGFIFGFMRTKGSNSYKKIPENNASLLVELE